MVDNYICDCDCECTKEMNEPRNPNSSLNQCGDCDDGIHYNNITKEYEDYNANS